jgi:hypothetical protein
MVHLAAALEVLVALPPALMGVPLTTVVRYAPDMGYPLLGIGAFLLAWRYVRTTLRAAVPDWRARPDVVDCESMSGSGA